MQTFNGGKEINAVESEAPSLEDEPALSLTEAEGILTALASVFFPADSAAPAVDSSEQQSGTFEADETPELEARYRILVEQIPAVVFMASLDKGVGEAYVSPQIEAILGFTQEEWLNDPVRWYQQVHPADKARWSAEAAQMFLSGQPLRSVYRVIARDGHVVWFHCQARMIRRDDGRPWFIHGVGFDITELKQAEEALRKAHGDLELRVQARTGELARSNAELQLEIVERTRAEQERAELLAREQEARKQAEEANRLKDEFLATVSHELRTPLTAIVGWSHMIRSGLLDQADSERAIESIERNAHAQTKLIEDLLDISRIITGKLRLNVREVDLTLVIEAAIDAVRPAAAAKLLELQTFFDPEASLVSADPDRMRQVVWNLLTNAIKFTPQRGRVAVQLERVDSHAQLTFCDSGEGISPEFLPFVFDRFRQADGSDTRAHGGLGLGLAIVRNLIELHGGTITADSRGLGRGATFTVKLPLARAHSKERSNSEQSQPSAAPSASFGRLPRLNGLRLLLVEDDLDAQEIFAMALKQCGAEVTAVASAAKALDALRESKIDILVSDIQMPEMNGYELMGRVRTLEGLRNIPAIALTAYTRAEDRTRSLLAGFQAHLSKPIEPAELVAVVASLAGRTGV
jgi:PAS domain S-box-containing protein